MIGRTLSHYRVMEELGRGGMGVVYRALDTKLGREVALKVLAPARRDPEQERRLRVEARAAAALAHPAVSTVYEIDDAEGATFIVMELVRGRPLASLIAERSLAPAQAIDLALEIAEGLAEAHARGVVHRDLKPRNVMLTDSGHAKIIDFGLAKLLRVPARPFESRGDTPAWSETDPGRIIGTAAYMSPEQVRGGEVDARSDVFAFGALLYEMLCGAPAFGRDTGVETLHAVLKEDAPRLRPGSFGPPTPLMQRVLDRCLAKAPEDRYASAGDLVADLREARKSLEDGSSAATVRVAARPAAAAGLARQGPLRVLIVDDEEPARALLREYLGAVDALVVGECRNGFEAVKAVNDLSPEILFLDIQMPKLDGFEVLELVGRDLPVVFVTAFDQHAIRAFEVNAVDYILKPVSAERVSAALERAARRLRERVPTPVAELAAAVRPAGPLTRIVVRQGPRVHVIPVDKLEYVEAQDDYVSLRSEGKAYLKQQTLSELAASLDPARFVRIHRSYVLNLDRLARIDTEDGEPKGVVLTDGTRLPLSRSGYGRIKGLL